MSTTTKPRKSPSPTSGSNPISQTWIPNCGLWRGYRTVGQSKHSIITESVDLLVPVGQAPSDHFAEIPGWIRTRPLQFLTTVSSDAIRRVLQ